MPEFVMPEFVKTHESLGADFFVPVQAAHAPKTILRYRNEEAASLLGLSSLDDQQWCEHFGHFKPFEGSFARPLALAYHGHQFGHYNPDIGDGRGFLFAQLIAPDTGQLLDFGTKGTGQTPFSRSGDGCLTLKGAVREILATELLQALGVPTSKTLSVIETGRQLERHDEPSPTRSAMLVRLSHSHIRIGSFQRHLYLQNKQANEALARYVVKHYYPHRDPQAPLAELVVTLLSDMAKKIAFMTGRWLSAGFVHGVLNTDNYNVTGESFDYGPWRFLPHLDPNFTAAYFDQQGRYAYGRQADASMWALCRFADCFVEQVDKEKLEEALGSFFQYLEEAMVSGFMRRLGLFHHNDVKIMHALLQAARASACPFDEMFRDLYGGNIPDKAPYNTADFAAYFAALNDRPDEGDNTHHSLSRSHDYFDEHRNASCIIDEVEALWAPIAEQDDWSLLHQKLRDIRTYGEMLARWDEQKAS